MLAVRRGNSNSRGEILIGAEIPGFATMLLPVHPISGHTSNILTHSVFLVLCGFSGSYCQLTLFHESYKTEEGQ